jgi:hypothetical protein
LWRNSDSNAKSKPLVAWNKCTRPKKKGGLGVINLRSQNSYLRMKFLDKLYNRKQIPWVNLVWNTYYSDGKTPHASKFMGSFWWRDALKLCDLFRGISNCKVGDGKTVLFWHDLWNDNIRRNKFPRLFTFAKNQSISVASFLTQENLTDNFHLPLTEQANTELQQLPDEVQQIRESVIEPEEKDSWSYIWGNSTYSSTKLYHYTFKNVNPPKPFLWILESRCSNKLKVFAWLLLMDMLNTRNILKRKNFKVQGDNYSCALCQLQREETAFHLFFNCPFSQDCWRHLNIQWNHQIDFFATFQQARDLHGSPFFIEVFIIAAWQIWKQRNNFIFDRGRPSFIG